MANNETPEGATHEREGDYYKVTSKVQYYEFGEWLDCRDAFDLSGWLLELTPTDTQHGHKGN